MRVLSATVLPAHCRPSGAAGICRTQKQLRWFPLLPPFSLIAVPCSNQPSWRWVLFPDLGQRSPKVFPSVSPPNTHAHRAVPPLPRGRLCHVDATGDGPPPSWGHTATRVPWFSSPQASAAGRRGIPLRRLSQG